jgi:hypothetical protein
MNNGWIKLHRKVLDNPYMRKPAYRSVWIEVLLMATHDNHDVLFKGKRITLAPGQFTCGRDQLSKKTGVPPSTCNRILKKFKSEQMIEHQSSNDCSLITVNNWTRYQGSEQQSEQRVNNEWTTSEHPVNTKQEGKNEKNERKKKTTKVVSEPAQYGNPKVNSMLEALRRVSGRDDFKESVKIQRQYANHMVHLIDRVGKDEFLRRLNDILGDGFRSKNCNSLKYLYGELKSASSVSTSSIPKF